MGGILKMFIEDGAAVRPEPVVRYLSFAKCLPWGRGLSPTATILGFDRLSLNGNLV